LDDSSHGGSQHSLNSTTTVSSVPSDYPDHIIEQKQRKELMEEGIKRYQKGFNNNIIKNLESSNSLA